MDGRVERLLLFDQSWSKKSRERRLVKVIFLPLENKLNVCFGLNHDYHLETRRRKLRKDLKCKSFRWYLETIYPESQVQHIESTDVVCLKRLLGCFPLVFIQMPLQYVHLGEVRSEESDRCLDTMSRKAGQKVETLKKERLSTFTPCQVGMTYCHGLGGNQVFAMTKKHQVSRC